MEELLKRWAAVEPERCQVDVEYYIGDRIMRGFHVELTLPGGKYNGEHFEHGGAAWYAPHIQAAVQEAIEARGWIYQQSIASDCAEMGKYYASCGWDCGMEERYADTQAEALLSAYLQAIEATTTQPA